jgi:hypothetical protein
LAALARPAIERVRMACYGGILLTGPEVNELAKAFARAVQAHLAVTCPRCEGSGEVFVAAGRVAGRDACAGCRGTGKIGDGELLADPGGW